MASSDDQTPSTVSQQPRPRRSRSPRWTKVFLTVGILGLLASTGSLMALQAGLDQVTNAVHQTRLLGPMGSNTSINDGINILVVGVGTTDPSGPPESMIVAHIPATHDRVYLVPLPRDAMVTVAPLPATGFGGGSLPLAAVYALGARAASVDTTAGSGSTVAARTPTGGNPASEGATPAGSAGDTSAESGGGTPAGPGDSITGAPAGSSTAGPASEMAGGFQLLARAIDDTWGLRFQGALAVTVDGFSELLAQLGGISMYLDEACSGTPTAAGWNHLDPAVALAYASCRDGLADTDTGRQRHQQQFLRAVVNEALQRGPTSPAEVTTFIDALGKAFLLDGRGVPVADWIFALKGIHFGAIVSLSRPITDASDPRDDLALLSAARDDHPGVDLVGSFADTHPDWVNR
jgi:anionic cell wall polymer biosynthesis LytR-Cps2A-Psr (LCP) family protein